MRKVFAWVALLVAALPAWGAGWTGHTQPRWQNSAPGKITMVPGGRSTFDDLISRETTSGNIEGAVILRDLLSKPSNTILDSAIGKNPPVAVTRTVTAKAVGKAVARAIPVIGAAQIAVDLAAEVGCTVSVLPPQIECNGAAVTEPADPGFYYCIVYGGQPACAKNAGGLQGHIAGILVAPGGPYGAGSRWVGHLERCTLTAAAPFSGSSHTLTCQITQRSNLISGICAPSSHGEKWCPMPDAGITLPAYYQEHNGPSVRCEFELQPDGTCIRVPTPDDFGDDVANDPTARPKVTPGVVDWMDDNGVDYETSDPEVTGPGSLPGGRIGEDVGPNGSTTTTDRTWDLTWPSGPSESPTVTVTPRDTVTTWPPGVTPTPYDGNPPTVPPGGTQGTNTGWGGQAPEIITCGLPNTPPCKIDETGTPPPDDRNPALEAEGVFAALKNCVLTPSSCVPALPSLNWTFALPSHCGPIPTPAFAPALSSINICPFQDVFHDLMGLLWAAAGLFGAVAMVFRDSTGGD